jgi:putative transposase
MAKKRFNPEQIITYLRKVEIMVSQSNTAGEACRQSGATERTYYC